MLFRDSLAVCPLKPLPLEGVDFLCEDDLEGTFRRVRAFFALLSSACGEVSSLAISEAVIGWSRVVSVVCVETSGLSDMMSGTKHLPAVAVVDDSFRG